MDIEAWAKIFAHHLSNVVEIVAAFVIAVSLLQFLFGYSLKLFSKDQSESNRRLRVRFGSTLAIALELLLAADILETAIAPTWDEIGKLAAIAAIRTALNYFLERELREIAKDDAAFLKNKAKP